MVSLKKSRVYSSVVFRKLGFEIILSYGLERNEAFENNKNVNF